MVMGSVGAFDFIDLPVDRFVRLAFSGVSPIYSFSLLKGLFWGDNKTSESVITSF
jgi:hypothetical protein